jgi:hypothetical protein
MMRQQDRSDGPRRTQLAAERLTVTGTLGLSRGAIVLETGDQIWYVPGLQRHVGFIDGLKDGAAATLEGWGVKTSRPDEDGGTTGFFRVVKLTLNGKDYDVGSTGPLAQGQEFNPGPMMGTPRQDRRPGHMMGRSDLGRGCGPGLGSKRDNDNRKGSRNR